jgi:hypothetical protein
MTWLGLGFRFQRFEYLFGGVFAMVVQGGTCCLC